MRGKKIIIFILPFLFFISFLFFLLFCLFSFFFFSFPLLFLSFPLFFYIKPSFSCISRKTESTRIRNTFEPGRSTITWRREQPGKEEEKKQKAQIEWKQKGRKVHQPLLLILQNSTREGKPPRAWRMSKRHSSILWRREGNSPEL